MAEHQIVIPHSFTANARETLRRALADLDGASVVVAETPTESRDAFETATIAVSRWLRNEWIEAGENLRWVQAISAGVDHYDLETLEERGIVLTNATGVHAQPIAEQVLGYMLAFERELLRARDQQSDGVWRRYEGGELATKTVGIVGLGAIGGRVAELASAVGSTVIGTKRDLESAPDAADEIYPPSALETVLSRSDYLVIACPLTEKTRGLIGWSEIETMPKDAVLVNVARGEIVHEKALIEGLQQNRIAGAALDVFEEEPLAPESPLWDLPNVLVTPHVAGSTPRYYERVAEIFVENYAAFREGDLDGMRNRIV